MTVKGHANSGEYGKDLVCASVSILTYTLAQNVATLYQANVLCEQPTINIGEGDCEIICRAKDDLTRDYVSRVFVTLMQGYLLLATNYPEYVDVKCKDF